jgi:Na+-transporting NADH:ubiquinone oxidoreductase subunit NqrB
MNFSGKQWDARYFQMAFQVTFLCYGILFLQWKAEWLQYLLFIGTGLFLQWVCDSIIIKKPISPFHWTSGGWKSALISTLSLCLLLKSNDWFICIIAAALTILSKYIFRIKARHIFNPSAFGIVSTIVLTNKAWLSPGQWGSSVVLLFAVCCLGFIVVTKVQKLDVTLSFLLTFAGLLFFRQVLYLNWSFDFFLQSLSTGSLLLFSFFMISDPRTAPNHAVARIVWAVLIAAVSFYLSAFKWMNSTPIYVLVLMAPLVPLLDHLMQAKKFEWNKNTFCTTEQKIQGAQN